MKEQGNLDDAGELYQSCLEIRRKKLGERHPLVANTLLSLGNVLNSINLKSILYLYVDKYIS